jgi:hypothetical protein
LRQMIDLVLVWDPLAAVDVNGNQMATWSYKRASLTASDTSVLASSYAKCLSVTSWPSLASIRSLVLHLGCCTCELIGRQPV